MGKPVVASEPLEKSQLERLARAAWKDGFLRSSSVVDGEGAYVMDGQKEVYLVGRDAAGFFAAMYDRAGAQDGNG